MWHSNVCHRKDFSFAVGFASKLESQRIIQISEGPDVENTFLFSLKAYNWHIQIQSFSISKENIRDYQLISEREYKGCPDQCLSQIRKVKAWEIKWLL